MKIFIEPIVKIFQQQSTTVLMISDNVFNDENELPLDEFSGLW